MKECICCQCQEDLSSRVEYFQCSACGLYGTEDDFDDSEDVCQECVMFYAKEEEAKNAAAKKEDKCTT